MIHPIRIANRTKAMNAPISGQNTRATLSQATGAAVQSGVQGDLLVGAGERPRHLHLALLAKHEAHLAGRPQSLGPVGTEGGTRLGRGDRTQKVGLEEAVFAVRSPHARPSVCHADFLLFHMC